MNPKPCPRPPTPKALPYVEPLGCVRLKDIKIKQRFRTDLGNIEALAESIKELGLIHPPTINEKNELIAGYRRIKAYEFLGWNEIPVYKLNLDDILRGESDENLIRKDFTASERVAIGIALEDREQEKAIQRQGRPGLLRSTKLAEQEKGEALTKVAKRVGWSRDTYKKAKVISKSKYRDLKQQMDKKGKINDVFKEWQRREEKEKRGQALKNAPKLKNLILGDARKELLKLDDKSIDVLITDPPFGVEYRGKQLGTTEGDDKGAANLLDACLAICKSKLKDNAHVYVFWSASAIPEGREIIERHFSLKNILVWIKNKAVILTSQHGEKYGHKYDVIFFAGNDGSRKLNGEATELVDVLEFSKVVHLKHPTQKPVELLSRLIENSTIQGETVLDPFCGSGSTLVAAERLGRSWVGIEIKKDHYDLTQERILEVRHNA